MSGSLAVVEKLTGTLAVECPWRAFDREAHPIVSDVLNVYPFFESGQMALVMGGDPPAKLVQAVGFYHSALTRARNSHRDDMRRNAASDSAHGAAVREMQRLGRG